MRTETVTCFHWTFNLFPCRRKAVAGGAFCEHHFEQMVRKAAVDKVNP